MNVNVYNFFIYKKKLRKKRKKKATAEMSFYILKSNITRCLEIRIRIQY